MFTRSLLLTGFAVLPLLPGSAFAAEPSRNIVEQATMALEWKSLSAVRRRVFSDWSTIDSATRILKLGADPQVAAELENDRAEFAAAKATLAARTAQMEAKLGPEELKRFKEEQQREAALVEVLQALEGMKKENRSAEKEAIDLGVKARALGESLKPLRASISSSLSGVVIPAEVQPGSH